MTVTLTDTDRLAIIAALDRAKKQIEAELDDKSAKLPEGTYPVELSIAINGDITKGPPIGGGKPFERRAFGDTDLVGAMFAIYADDPAAMEEDCDDAVKLISHARSKPAVQAKLAAGNEIASATLLKLAKKRKLVETGETPPRAGRTDGKPTVVITGNVDKRIVSIDINTGEVIGG